jgi:predicted O-linked N-acetylglucosamine transferase (SPINDLY family)
MMSADVAHDARLSWSASMSGNEPIGGLSFPTAAKPRLVQRYNVLPMHNSGWHQAQSAVFPNNPQSVPRAENTLRRKTPNGTLNAGYDASVEDLSQPLKRQLLPLSEASALAPITFAASANGKRTFLEHERALHQQQSAAQGQLPGWSGSASVSFPNGQAMYDRSVDSYSTSHFDPHLKQRMGGHPYQQQTVPSVMQPSLQHLGPTASGGQASGPYGPYWHDGTFLPYRPAAIHDPRFYPQPAANTTNKLSHNSAAYSGYVWQQDPRLAHSPSIAQRPDESTISTFHTARLSQHTTTYHQFGARNTFRERLPQGSSGLFENHDIHEIGSRGVEIPAASLDYGSTSANGMHRDKIFSWALQQYKELLAYIHHNRQSQGQPRSAQRPSFYPRPPRPTAKSPISMNTQSRQIYDEATKGLQVDLQPSIPSAKAFINRGEGTRRFDPSTSLMLPSPRQDSISNRHVREKWQHPPDQPRALPPTPAVYRTDTLSALAKTTSPPHSTLTSPQVQDETPPSRALVALQQIDVFCQKDGWRWVDGMQLGGCLAYGLNDHSKAQVWFRRVLDKDPNHLEATSNLAATMLALGQRREAEQHWMKVVKVAPTYFEAVEHLVGLLCNEQRSKDAIKVVEYVERSLRQRQPSDQLKVLDRQSECSSSTASRSPRISELSETITYDYDLDGDSFVNDSRDTSFFSQAGFGTSGYAIPGSENGRMLALIHAKGNMLYGVGDNGGAASAFEEAVLIATGRKFDNIQSLVEMVLKVVSATLRQRPQHAGATSALTTDPVLLSPEEALNTAKLCFLPHGELPGLVHIAHNSLARKAIVSTTSNSLLSLAKIFQDGMSNPSRSIGVRPLAHGVRDILALYYMSLALQPSPSTANNVGILLASVQQVTATVPPGQRSEIPGVLPGSGTALALSYYNYGLQLDKHHAHLYTNLGSLLKDIGQLDAAINMYERAVQCDGNFDIALANLANAVKDKGRTSDAIMYYKRAVKVSPDFAEAVCGLANALNSVCSWQARGGIVGDCGRRDRWHVDPHGMLLDATKAGAVGSGWIKRVVDIVEKQLSDGENWGRCTSSSWQIDALVQQLSLLEEGTANARGHRETLRSTVQKWAGQKWEGARITRFVERATKRIGWHWYRDRYVTRVHRPTASYNRPQLPAGLAIPTVPTVLPFHTFTCPMSAKQVRQISQRNGLRISVSALRSPWLPRQVYPPPKPPSPCLKVGYVSSDFNNHPLAHLMQSVFGMHDTNRVQAYCYATTPSDNSVHRRQIQSEAPVFHDASSWSAERLVQQIVQDGVHILINLNGYTRGARNEVFAARPAPIQMSFMGFASTLGAEWCDYLLADETAIPVDTLRPWRRNVDLKDQFVEDNNGGDDDEDWVYGENIIYCRDTFFCCDHRQSAPDAQEERLSWNEEQSKRWKMRKELFPQISDDTIVFGNFNQLYKVSRVTGITETRQ